MSMTPLFSADGMRRLQEVARPGLLCAFDFDGTLAPIVTVPGQAGMPQPIAQKLQRLASLAPIAIITGRALDDIRPRLPFAPDFLVGNHGLEGLPGWEAHAADHERLCAAWLRQLTEALHGRPEAEGIALEDKRYSLSVHYRVAPSAQRARSFLDTVFAALSPQPRVVSGKCVYNLVPEAACHKGAALERLIASCGARAALYAGDDVTDEDAFRVKRPDLLSVRVEASAESEADCYLPSFDDMAGLLDELIARLEAQGAANWMRAAGAAGRTAPAR
ncbi:MAG TPA: trehalose-phosphatase [Noviherbaspirillum sp.]|uniref:trehalose-phosphatase n=1 Tax=Noviherbaspirillum sp. TaxID=1926288 RepID=UPI002D5EEC55|nr:trehalose-phosphatase [Noviherbaspirillum sp.]HYD95844.1 trehalose-phosphatase [Noviherbaspirillum sp.]